MESQRTNKVSSEQLQDIKNDWQEIEQLLFCYKTLLETYPRNPFAILETEQLLDRKIEEYAAAKLYIYAP